MKNRTVRDSGIIEKTGFGRTNYGSEGAEFRAGVRGWLHACAYAEHGANHAVQRIGRYPRETAGRHHGGCELWQLPVLRGEACGAAEVEELWR